MELNIRKRESLLDGLVLYEPIDINLLDKCINSRLLKTNYQDEKWFKNEKQQLEKYRMCILRGFAQVQYKRKNGYGLGRVNPVGSMGLHSLTRATRHTLVKYLMVDIDIENAHIILLLQILIYNNFDGDYDMLEDYVKNRSKWLEEIIDVFKILERKDVKENPKLMKEISKQLIIRILYGGSIEEWLKKWEFDSNFIWNTPCCILDLQKQIRKIHAYICDANPDLYAYCKQKNIEKHKDYNHEGTTASWFLQEKESLVLEVVYKYCIANGYVQNDICALCNDGIMLEKQLYEPELLKKLNQVVKDETGFDLNFVEKPLDEDYLDILDENLHFNLYDGDELEGVYADYFKMLYHDKFIVKNNHLYFYNGVYWEKDEHGKATRLSSFVDNEFKQQIVKNSFRVRADLLSYSLRFEEWIKLECKYDSEFVKILVQKINERHQMSINITDIKNTIVAKLQKEDKSEEDIEMQIHTQVLAKLYSICKDKISEIVNYIKKVEKYLRSVSSRDKLVKDILRVLTTDYIEFDENPFHLCLLNRVYDLKTGTFITPHYSQYNSMNTGWKWVSGYNPKYKKELEQVLLPQIFPKAESRKLYLMLLATGLFGKVIQHFFIAKGVGGNGKSVIDSLMIRTGGNYAYKLPSTAVLQNIKEGANPTIANLHNKRFILVQEPDKKHRINTSTIKEITGDKELNCRTLYSTNTTTKLKGTLVMECNDLPQLDETGDAITRRIILIPFTSRFLTDTMYKNTTQEEIDGGGIYRANPAYIDDQFQDEYKQAFMMILMEHFRLFQADNYTFKNIPKECTDEAKEYMKFSDDIYGWFDDKYAKDKEGVIPFKDVWHDFEYSTYYTNLSKADKRRFNQKKLKEVIQTNSFLKHHYKSRMSMFNKEPLSSDSIVGYRHRYDWDEEDADCDFEEDTQTTEVAH